MKYWCLFVLAMELFRPLPPLLARNGEPDWNVNSRYTVESAELQTDAPISRSLRSQMRRLVGSKLSPVAVSKITIKLADELRGWRVRSRLERGNVDGRLRVVWEVQPQIPAQSGSSAQQFAGPSGVTSLAESVQQVQDERMSLQVGVDSNQSIEQRHGFRARYQAQTTNPQVTIQMEAGEWHQDWDKATVAGTRTSDLYATRQYLAPSVTIALGDGWTWTAGATLEYLRPVSSENELRIASSLDTALNFHHLWVTDTLARQQLDATYSGRFAMRALASDFGYSRQQMWARYQWSHDRKSMMLQTVLGTIGGEAPLYDRFILGTSEQLRGWNKFDVAAAGGNRMAYGSVEAGYGRWRAFYDTGAVWQSGRARVLRHAVGGGIQGGPVTLSVAFPIREGQVVPVLIAALRF